jgi:hypothetical protein
MPNLYRDSNHQVISLFMDADIKVGQAYDGLIRIHKVGLTSSVQVLIDQKIAKAVAEAIGYVPASISVK